LKTSPPSLTPTWKEATRLKKMFAMAVALAILSVPAFAQNLLVNGDFETGDLTGWTLWASPWSFDTGTGLPNFNSFVQPDVTTGPDSFNALNLNASSASFGLVQEIEVEVGKTYEINGYIMGGGISHWIEVMFFNDDGRSLLDQLDDYPDTYGGINRVVSKIDGQSGIGGFVPSYASIADFYSTSTMTNRIVATSPVIYVALKSGTSAGMPNGVDGYFDDFSVEVVPEPTSLAALAGGLGMLGLSLRRRTR
jgi:hypothetical protein